MITPEEATNNCPKPLFNETQAAIKIEMDIDKALEKFHYQENWSISYKKNDMEKLFSDFYSNQRYYGRILDSVVEKYKQYWNCDKKHHRSGVVYIFEQKQTVLETQTSIVENLPLATYKRKWWKIW